MLVRDRMTPDPICGHPEMPVTEAQSSMREKNIRHLPIVDEGGSLVGLVTQRSLLRALPSDVSNFSRFEISYVLSKIKVDHVMVKDVFTKMRPMDFMEEGIFICGMAHYPKFIKESISHALATAGRAITILSKQPFYIGGTIAVVDQDKCVGCLTCVRVCPFHIPKVDPHSVGVGEIVGAAYIEPALCHGCGTCTAECPATAIQLLNYTDTQIMVPETPVLGSWVAAHQVSGGS